MKKGDTVILDNRVPGKIHGWYEGFIVFESQYKFGGVLYGRMPMGGKDPDHPDAEKLDDRISTLSLIIVHPENLKTPEPRLGYTQAGLQVQDPRERVLHATYGIGSGPHRIKSVCGQRLTALHGPGDVRTAPTCEDCAAGLEKAAPRPVTTTPKRQRCKGCHRYADFGGFDANGYCPDCQAVRLGLRPA